MYAVLKGCLIIFTLFFTSLIGEFVVGCFCFPLFLCAPQYFRYAFDAMTGAWQSFVIVILEIVGGIHFESSGDNIRAGERSLIIMNHRTRLDWMFFWAVLTRQSGTQTLKITLKSSLKYVPGPGWAMQNAAYIFLQRKWEEDEKVIKKMLQYYAELKYPCQVLIFPEGTNLTSHTKQISDKYADKNNLTKLDFVLHPRVTGFACIVDYLKQRKHLDCIYDVTVAYPDSIPENGSDILFGRLPHTIHFHVNRHPVPSGDHELGEWLVSLWHDKEAWLRQFYADKRRQTAAGISKGSDVALTYRCRQVALCVIWFGVVGVMAVLLWNSLVIRCCAILWLVMHLVANRLGGLDQLQADYYSWWNRRRASSRTSS